MDRKTPEMDRARLLQHRIVTALRRRRPVARVQRTSQGFSTNAVTSFGMIIGLLMIWAMAVTM